MKVLMRLLNRKWERRLYCTAAKLKPPWNVMFFGSDKFSLASLDLINKEKNNDSTLINDLEVVTNIKNTTVRNYALNHSLPLHQWPLAVPPTSFHVGLVVSFGHLIPKEVIEAFPMGILNVHASLLPRWRGGAPIIYAIANGDSKTGISIMRIRPEKFDVGEIIAQEEVCIGNDEKMPELHRRLALIGAENLVRTLRGLPEILLQAKPQSNEGVTLAPRVNSALANVDFCEQTAKRIYDLSRALAGLFPLSTRWNGVPVKLHGVVGYESGGEGDPGSVAYDKRRKLLTVRCSDGCILVDRIGVTNKKVMNASDFNNGYLKKLKGDECRVFR